MKLFQDEIGKNNISTEMIEVQNNDADIARINSIFKEIIEYSNKLTVKNGIDFINKKPFKPLINEIDKIIGDRFGIKCKHIHSEGTGYACIPSSPPNYNIINKSNLEIYERYKNIKSKRNYDNIDNYTINTEPAILKKHIENMNAVKKSIKDNDFRIDLNKARIYGLPSSYKVSMLVDLKMMIYVMKCDANELTAILLHEIGHIFTHLEYVYRNVEITSSLIDIIQEESIKKNKGSKQVLQYVYEELGGDDDITGVNTVTATIKVYDEYRRYLSDKDSETEYRSTDSEALADMFSNRFGYGIYLATGLDKMYAIYRPKTNMLLGLFNVNYGLFILLLLEIIMYGVAATIIFFIIINIIISVITGGGTKHLVYDTDVRRFIKIKNEMVRQLRSMNGDKESIKTMLKSLDQISDIIKNQPKDMVHIFDKIVRLFNSKAGRRVSLRELDELVDDLTSNDLHIVSNKLKLIKGSDDV